MKINFFLFLLLASNAVSAELVNEILVDEFTDEETVALTADWYKTFYDSSEDMLELTNRQITDYAEKLANVIGG